MCGVSLSRKEQFHQFSFDRARGKTCLKWGSYKKNHRCENPQNGRQSRNQNEDDLTRDTRCRSMTRREILARIPNLIYTDILSVQLN